MTLILRPDAPRGILLFAPGAGGDPTRYRHLLEAVCDAGFVAAAPAHAEIDSPTVTDTHLRERVAALRELLAEIDRPDLPVTVAGHSAGGWAALCLVGAAARDRQGVPFDVPHEPRVERAVLLAPATGWFRGADAFDEVTVPLTVLVGSRDDVTPPETADVLQAAPASVDLRRYDGVGHFDFMSPLPEGKEPVVADHAGFSERLAADVIAAAGGPQRGSGA